MSVVTYLSFALVVLLIFTVPGWLFLRRFGVDPLMSLYGGPAVGALAAAAIVAVGVLLPWSVRTTCVAGAVAIALAAIYCGVTAPRPLGPPRLELAGMAVFVVAFISMAAFSAVPSQPYGEWSQDTVGPGRVDSPRWPGLPSDNTLPYRTGQVALYKQGGAQIRDQYAVGWWLSDRTPLTGLDFAFAAGAMGVHVANLNIEEIPPGAVPMEVTDGEGFWAYQVVAILLNLTIILGVYLLARVWRGPRVAAVAALVAAIMPGLFLNAIYTWPKQGVAYFVLIAAACALRRRPALAGLFAGLGYLTHPAGVLWIPALALLLLCDPELRARLWSTLLRFLVPAAVVAAPWEFFTSQIMHAVSRWTTAPLGVLMTDPTHFGAQLSIAWRDFLDNGVMFAIWTRIQSTAGSLWPGDLGTTPVKLPTHGFGPQIMVSWSAAHGFSIWGMAGLVLFPFAAAYAVRDWSRVRRLVLWFVLPAVVVAELANGESYPFANQSMFALVGIIAIIAAAALLDAGRRTRIVILAATAFELLTVVYGGLYRPFNASAATVILLTAIAVAGQLALFAALAAALDLVPLRYSSSAIRGASRLKVQ
jgi:Dolichyl-phosphate-mannose-protein mannosyltransferase